MLTIASDRAKGRARRGPARRAALLLAGAAALVTGAVSVGVAPSAQAATGQKLDLRVLVVDDGSGRVDPLSQAMTLEGLPFTTVTLGDPSRPQLTAAFLASGTEGRFQAIVLPNESGPGLSVDEAAALRTYETTFGVRQVDAYTSGGSALGLDAPGYNGPLNGMTAAVTADGQAQGFGYLTGPVPMAIGSYGYLSMPLSPLPAGTTFTSLVTAPIPGTDLAGSLVGAFTSAGRSELAITMNYNPGQSHFRMLAHGIISWMTQGIHFGYNRNNFTFHFDDAFAPDARWDMDNNCTPGEDCPATVAATPDIRMTAEDVAHVAAWVQTSGYKPTLAFNGYYSQYDSDGAPWNGTDGLTNALLANKDSFRWLNHGYVHIYQGCVQNFAVAPWTCATTTPEGAVAWTSEGDISSEITANITRGNALGLSFDATEYLSGEHSGLQSLPQMPTDNPNFAAALTANGIKVIGSDASRETGTRTVGSAQTIPRHPTALYYNTSTAAEAVDEYNWFYAPSPAGNCVATSTTTCLPAPLDGSSGTVPGTTPAASTGTAADAFTNYIVPSDAAYDLSFILSNDPRPFYAHVSNLTGPDYLGLQLIDQILKTYNASFAANAPLLNLTETQAATALAQQSAWAADGMPASSQITGYVQDGKVIVSNPTGTQAPLTVPAGTSIDGAAFGASYGGELSGWTSGNLTLTLPVPAPPIDPTPTPTPSTPTTPPAGGGSSGGGSTGGGSTGGGQTPTDPSTTPTPTPTPTTDPSQGQTPPAPVKAPKFTSAAAATFPVGRRATFKITTVGTPDATLSVRGTLPAGVRFSVGAHGTATIAGTPAAKTAKKYPVTIVATNGTGTVRQSFTLTVTNPPAFTSAKKMTTKAGRRFSFTVRTSGYPVATRLSVSGAGRGVVFRNNGNGTATLTGVLWRRGSRVLIITARSTAGAATQSFTVKVT